MGSVDRERRIAALERRMGPMTKEQILEAVADLYSDRSFSLEQAKENMGEIIDACQMNVDALDEDIAREARIEDGSL